MSFALRRLSLYSRRTRPAFRQHTFAEPVRSRPRSAKDGRGLVNRSLGTRCGHLYTEGNQAGTHLADDVLGFRPGRLERAPAFDGEAQDLAIGTLNKVPAVGVVIARPRRRIQAERLFEVVACPARGGDRLD